MTAIDTNLLVRLVTRDHPAQYHMAAAFIEKHQPVWVTHLSVLELAWVLLSRYRLGKDRICEVIRMMLDMAELNIQQPVVLEGALETWSRNNVDFADAFILETVRAAGEAPLATFDVGLGKLEGALPLNV